MSNQVIFTNKALGKMAYYGLSERYVMDAFNYGEVENSIVPGAKQAVKKYSGYEIGVIYSQDRERKYKIISVWKRNRR